MVFHQSVIQIPNIAHAPLSRSNTLSHTTFHRLSTSDATAHCPWSIGGYYQNCFVIEKEARYLGLKEKKRSFSRLLDDKPRDIPYPYYCGLVELEIPHPKILEATSPTYLSTIPIHLAL